MTVPAKFKLKLVLMTAAVLAACFVILVFAPRLLPSSALQGVWVHRDGDQISEMELFSDGRFTLTHVPRSVIDTQYLSGDGSIWAETIDGDGSWSRYSSGQIILGISSGEAAGVGQISSIGGWPWALEIWIAYGDPEVGRTFHFTKQ